MADTITVHPSAYDSAPKRVAVVGTGLVGWLAALGLATKFRWAVDVYELRGRTSSGVDEVRAINLALSSRGLRSFEEIDPDLALEMRRIGVPLHGRQIHDLKGNSNFQAYGPNNEAIFSINRYTMVQLLRDRVEACPLIRMHFSHKLVASSGRELQFVDPDTGETIHKTADLIIGCDGAFSSMREQMRRTIKMDISTTWTPMSYMKIEVAPRKLPNGEEEHAFDPSVLHVWPRKKFLLIAPSNPDMTFTCVLWAPDALLEQVKDDSFAREFFPKHFPSFMKAITIDDIVKQTKANPIVPMCSIKCNPLNDGHRVLIGDASHVIVPYLGHGANVGYEDVRVLIDCLAREPDQKRALDAYSAQRYVDIEAINRVSWDHIHELADHVLRPSYLLRKRLDFALARLMPGRWAPLYAAVTFDTDTPYSLVIKRETRQTLIVRSTLALFACFFAVALRFVAQLTHHSLGSMPQFGLP